MLSLDFAFLVTNIPFTETIKFLSDGIVRWEFPIGMAGGELKELLFRCTLNFQLSFDANIYGQVDGVAMLSPLELLPADVFKVKLENNQLSPVIKDLFPYARYVDDIFAIADEKLELDTFLDKVNQVHQALTSTLEK
ncbi:unnamed protein product [Schistocephalus solidus]|uniref:Reverse transcriptase domain-containing protein n=1 Tax=Schistocephalus solidus TaxID=70667 RepID=A0A183TL19_SCHSO|nr:unnamed protein product [Schistocephalus solidus]